MRRERTNREYRKLGENEGGTEGEIKVKEGGRKGGTERSINVR